MKLIIIFLILILSGCSNSFEYDNPDLCENVFRTNGSKSFVDQAYNAPNCFEYGYGEGTYYMLCCNDENVRYKG